MAKTWIVGVAGAIGTAALVLMPCCLPAQGSLEDRKKASLRKPFLANAPWVSSLERAKADARETGKLIFGYFSRSYAP